MWAVNAHPQLGYYPPSLSTTPFQLEYYPFPASLLLPPQFLKFDVRRRNRSCTRFSSIPFAEPSLFYVLLGSRPDGAVTLSQCHPPEFCDFLEELVVGDGVKTLGLHLRATCRGAVLLIFGSIYFRSYIIVYTDSLIFSSIICVQVNPLK